MKKLLLFSIVILVSACGQSGKDKAASAQNTTPSQKYILTYEMEDFDETTNKLGTKKQVDTLLELNDTTAYLTAVKNWYAKKVEARNNLQFGLYKSFSVTDKSGIDLTLKLSDKIVTGINNQVKSQPEVKKMLDETARDSMPY